MGAALTVFLGWVATDDGIKVYLGLIGAMIASSAAFITGRVINEVADRRDMRRKIHAALEKMETARKSVQDLKEALNLYIAEHSDDRLDDVAGLRQAMGLLAEDVPDLSECLESIEDRLQARLIRIVFARLRMHFDENFRSLDPAQRRERTKAAVFAHVIDMETQEGSLQHSIEHFERRLADI